MRNLMDDPILSRDEATRIKAFGALVICALTFSIAGWAGNKVFQWKQAELIRDLNESQMKYDILVSKSDPFTVVMAEREFEEEIEREKLK